MSTQCCRICYCLFENLFLWYAFCHAGTGVESVYTDTGIFIYCNECCFNRCSHQYCVGPNFLFLLYGWEFAAPVWQQFSRSFVPASVLFAFSSLRKVCFIFLLRICRFLFARIANIVSLGFTPFIMTLTECAIQIVFNINLNHATGGNKDYTVALTVMLSALQLISLPLNGLGNGMQPFVSYNYGKGNAERLKQGIQYVTVIAFIFAVSIWSVSLAVPQMYAHIFSSSEAVTGIVKHYTPFFLMGSIMFLYR